MRLFANANYDFLSRRRVAYLVTLAIMLSGLIILALRGVNYSVEFTGGTLIQVQSQKPVDVGSVRNALAARGIEGAEIQTFGSERELVIRARLEGAGTDQNDTQTTARALQQALDSSLGAGSY